MTDHATNQSLEDLTYWALHYKAQAAAPREEEDSR